MDEQTSQVTNLISTLQIRLKTYFQNNSTSELKEKDGKILIVRPWGDESLTLAIEANDNDAIDTLNSICLPPRFSAIFHCDKNDLEIIYFAFLQKNDEEQNRVFEFDFNKKKYKCEFGEPSDRLWTLARIFNCERSFDRSSNYRNLETFKAYANLKLKKKDDEFINNSVPLCFWIRNVKLEEDNIVELARHLNLYMHYFDNRTPRIIIHDDLPIKSDTKKRPVRYPFDNFPKVIRGSEIDPYLLGLWESSVEVGDPFRKFLYNYQILEYAAFYYLQENILFSIKKLLLRPDFLERLNEIVSGVLDIAVEGRMEDESKIVAVIKQAVDPKILWKLIEPNIEYFSSTIKFDGGFELSPLIKNGWELEDFKTAIQLFPYCLRKLRNALVHSRESRAAACIAPTRANHERLRPWLLPLSFASMQAIIYRHSVV